MSSIQRRLMFVSVIVLFGFLGATGGALYNAYKRAAKQAREDRLKGHIYTLLAAADVKDGKLIVSEAIPAQKLHTPDSGLYAIISDKSGKQIWNSPSLLGDAIEGGSISNNLVLEPGNFHDMEVVTKAGNDVFILSYGVSWQNSDLKEYNFVFSVAEDSEVYSKPTEKYKKNLWMMLGLSSFVLLITQMLVLRWGMKPLRTVESDLLDIEAGRAESLNGKYPDELKGLTSNINTLIANERSRLENYRNTLANLAHSLKTPLAVLRSGVESLSIKSNENKNDINEDDLLDQVSRIDNMIEYQLSRAATSGHITFSTPIQVKPIVEKLVNALNKVNIDRGIKSELKCDNEIMFGGVEGDLMELCGNLLDNAYKWGDSQVKISFEIIRGQQTTRTGFLMKIEDDGPGISEEERQRVLQRGERADQQIPGHGIGLAVVKDIVDSYFGRIDIEKSELGGAKFLVKIPPQ